MKVCTDACLFGAWINNRIQRRTCDSVKKVLDIGTGTGLLALMLAQNFQGHIDAVEIDANAAQQASDNIATSSWSEKVFVHHTSVSEWKQTGYDLIISNPPFFEQNLRSPHQQRNLALHDTGLTLEQLWENVMRCIQPDGFFAVLLPYHRLEDCLQHASNNGFFLHEKAVVHQTEKHAPFRVMLLFGKQETQPFTSSIIIKKEGSYSSGFIELLKEYYLYL